MHVVDGDPPSLGKLTVDLADQQFDLAPQLLVIGNFFPAGNNNLQQRDFVSQLRKAPQQDAKSFQPFRNALGVIHAVHAKHNEVVRQLAPQLCGQGLNIAASGMARELLERNADWERRHPCASVIHRYYIVRLFSGPGSFGYDPFEAA